ncbi:RNA-binding protein S1, partial [Salmonella enterica subsp. enterica serovar Enteritidis]|uniref:RNA-binding protein S1 n=1 Tax=Salmonella enterica TaxID=28901 RepID=UPI000976C2DC
INEHLKVGEQVEVKLINVETDGKIGLCIKKASDRPQQQSRPSRNDFRPKESFEQKMNKFLKDSEDRLTSLKRNTESKRGGRGARRG